MLGGLVHYGEHHARPNLSWQESNWQAEARAWIRSSLQKHDLRLTGEIEQPHIRPWSTVMTVPTTGGMFYFKAAAAVFSHEAALTDYLVKFRRGFSRTTGGGFNARLDDHARRGTPCGNLSARKDRSPAGSGLCRPM